MERKEKIKRFIISISCALGVAMLAKKISPVYALALLTYFFINLCFIVEDISNVITELPKFTGNVTGGIKDGFENMKKELPEKIYKALKKASMERQIDNLLKCTVRPGGVQSREDAIEVINEFKRHGVELFHTDTADKINKLDDKALISAALNLIELKSQAESRGE